MMRRVSSLLAVSLLGCEPGEGQAPWSGPDASHLDAEGPPGLALDAAPPDAAESAESLTVLFSDAEGLWRTADSGRVPYVWGFQGGTMIRPVIVVDDPDFAAHQSVLVQISHAPDPAAPDAYPVESAFERLTLELVLHETPRGLATTEIDDLLAWHELAGSRLLFSASIDGLDATWSRTLELYLHDAGPHPCDAISEASARGDDCRVAVFSGDVLIDDVGPHEEQCAPLTLIGDGPFRPPLGDQCSPRLGIEPAWETDVLILGPEGGPMPTTRCAEALGIVPGARLPGSLRVEYGPGCEPRPRVTLDVDTVDCTCPG